MPEGFCISTEAFKHIVEEKSSIGALLDRLSHLKVADRDEIRGLGGEIRRAIEGTAIPEDLGAAIARLLSRPGEENACAVRSSATAEDLPTTSFAAILEHISKCWASLFTCALEGPRPPIMTDVPASNALETGARTRGKGTSTPGHLDDRSRP